MNVSVVSKVAIDVATGIVSIGFCGDAGDIEITVPTAMISTLTNAIRADELAVRMDVDNAALAVACLRRVRDVHALA